MQRASTATAPGKGISAASFGYRDLKIIMASPKIIYEELLGGSGYARILGWPFVKGDVYSPYGGLPSG